MKRKPDLHALIHALSRAEKRYFTLDARKGGKKESRYLQLFQAINAQDSYDEAALKKKFTHKLTDDKGRLYEAILRSMRDYRSQRSRTARIKELLLDANFLYERGLYEQTSNRLSEARRIASQLEDQPARLEINREIRRVLNTLTATEEGGSLASLQAESATLLSLLDVEFHYLNLHDELIREVQRRRKGKREQSSGSLEERYADSLFNKAAPDSIRGRLRFLQSRAMYFQLKGEPAGVYENFLAVNDWWNRFPRFKQEEFNRYLDDAFNLLHATFQHKPAISEAPHLLDRLAEEQPASAHDQAVLFQRTSTYRLFYAINYDFQRPADEILLPIREGLAQVELHPVSEMTIRFNAAILYFIQGAAASCEEWLTSIIDLKGKQIRPDITRSARLLRLITLVDQEMNEDFLEAALRSELRQVNKDPDDKLAAFAKWIIRFLKQWTTSLDRNRPELAAAARNTLLDDWQQQLPLGLEELVGKWLEAKEKKKKVLEVM